MIKIICPNGSLVLPKDQIINSPFMNDTLIHRSCCDEKYSKKDSIFIPFDNEIVRTLIPLIREGIFYNTENDKFEEDKIEICKMFEYVGLNNPSWNYIRMRIKFKSINIFGGNHVFDICSYDEYPFILSDNKDKDDDINIKENRMEKAKELFNEEIKEFVKFEVPKVNKIIIDSKYEEGSFDYFINIITDDESYDSIFMYCSDHIMKKINVDDETKIMKGINKFEKYQNNILHNMDKKMKKYITDEKND